MMSSPSYALYVCVHARAYVCLCERARVCRYLCVCVRVCVCGCVCMCLCEWCVYDINLNNKKACIGLRLRLESKLQISDKVGQSLLVTGQKETSRSGSQKRNQLQNSSYKHQLSSSISLLSPLYICPSVCFSFPASGCLCVYLSVCLISVHVFQCVYMCLCLCSRLCLPLFSSLSVCMSVSMYLFDCLTICVSVCLLVYVYFCLSFCLYICVCMPVYLFTYLSVVSITIIVVFHFRGGRKEKFSGNHQMLISKYFLSAPALQSLRLHHCNHVPRNPGFP